MTKFQCLVFQKYLGMSKERSVTHELFPVFECVDNSALVALNSLRIL